METTTPTQATTQQDPVKSQFAAALRQYQYYSHGRSLRKFCEDEGLDYPKFCKYAREHGPGSDAGKQTGSADALPASFIEVPQEAPAEPVSIREIRTDYSKQKDYTENAIYHSLGEYFTLGEGETFATRDGEIDINLVKVIIRYPEKIEEHIYETATVRSADAEDYRTASRLGLDLPCPGCWTRRRRVHR